MAYLGNDLQVAYQSYKIIDDISSSFNSSLTSFPLQVGGIAPVPFPINPQQCLISVNGVVQEPDPTGTSGFNLVGSNIVFASAPTTGHSFFGVILAGADYVNVGVNYPSGSVSAPSITFNTDLDTGIYNPAANELGLVTNGNDAVRIDSSGRVGLGTSSPSSLLDVEGIVTAKAGAFDAGGFLNKYGSDANSRSWWVKTDTHGFGDFAIRQSTTQSGSSYDTKLLINSTGNVGIGTTSPQGNLEVSNSSSGATIRLSRPGSADYELYASSDTFIITDKRQSVERLRIDSSGRLLVGTSTARSNYSGITPNFQFEHGSGNDQRSFAITHNATNVAGPILFIGKSRGSTVGSNTVVASGDELGQIVFNGADGTNMIQAVRITAEVDGTPGANDMPGRLVFSTTNDGASSPTEAFRMTQDKLIYSIGVYGNTTAVGANVTVLSTNQILRSTSSGKYKTEVEDVEDVYSDAILQCRPVWYRSICKADCPDHSYWGFIAEEVAEIDPRLVHWKTCESQYDESGSVVSVPCEPEPEGVAYDRFVPHLLNLIKRQKKQIEAQGTAIAALEARLSALEAH